MDDKTGKEGQQTEDKDREEVQHDSGVTESHTPPERRTEAAPDPMPEGERPKLPEPNEGEDGEDDEKEPDTSAKGSPGAKARADASNAGSDSSGEKDAPKNVRTVLSEDLRHVTQADAPGFAPKGAPSAVRNTPTPGINQPIYGVNEPAVQEIARQSPSARRDPFDHDGDGKPGGSLPKAEKKATTKTASKKKAAKK